MKDLHRLEAKLWEKQQKEEESLERQRRMAKIKEKVLEYIIVTREKHGLNQLTYCSFPVLNVTCANLHSPALHVPRLEPACTTDDRESSALAIKLHLPAHIIRCQKGGLLTHVLHSYTPADCCCSDTCRQTSRCQNTEGSKMGFPLNFLMHILKITIRNHLERH